MIYCRFVSVEFLGDIAIPVSDQKIKPKAKISNLQEEIEKYKQEVLEGLQIEEEGLTDFIRKKTKQNPPVNNTQKYNDPTGDVYFSSKNHKNGQDLKTVSNLNTNKASSKTKKNSSGDFTNSSTLDDSGSLKTKDDGIATKKRSATKIPSSRRKRHESRRKHRNK